MQHPDEGTIHAWLDGALPDDERIDVEQHVASCAACSLMAAEARGTIAGASRIVGALDMVPGGVLPKSADAPQTQPSSLWRMLRITPARAALAASLLVAASLVVTKRHDTPDKMVPHAPIAIVRPDTVVVAAPPAVAAPAPAPAVAVRPSVAKVAQVAQRVDSAPRDTTPQALVVTSAASSAAAPARLSFSATRMSELARNRGDANANAFVGCYQIGHESAREIGVLPERFALELSTESVARMRNIVRGVTPEGRIDSVLAGSSWHIVTPRLSNVSLASPSGERRLNVSLTPGGMVMASVATDTVPTQIALSRITCRP